MRFSPNALRITADAEHPTGSIPAGTYVDPSGKLVAGYGHVLTSGRSVVFPIPQARAMDLLKRDLELCSGWLVSRLADRLNSSPGLQQHHFDALVCWAYHALSARVTAMGQYPESARLIEYVNARAMSLAAAEFDNWVYVKDRYSRAAAQRRLKEQGLFIFGA